VGGADRAHAGFGQQRRHKGGDELVELPLVGSNLLVQQADLLG